MAITKLGMLVLVAVGLLAMVQQSVQMSDDTSMLRETGNDLSSLAIVFSTKTSESAILDSGDFVLKGTKVIAGRVFRTGTLSGRSVVLVNTGRHSANVASALQIAMSTYRIRGVLYLGLAGSLRRSILPPRVGSVVVPKSVAFTGLWDWLPMNADEQGDLVFGSFNEGGNPQNALGSAKFNNVTLYTGDNHVSRPFYLETPEEWLERASAIRLPHIQIHTGMMCSSSDMKVKNAAYASFLLKSFEFRTVDQESSTVALVSKSNNKPYIVFHGVSNTAAGPPATVEVKRRAAENAYQVLKAFLNSLPEPRDHLTALE